MSVIFFWYMIQHLEGTVSRWRMIDNALIQNVGTCPELQPFTPYKNANLMLHHNENLKCCCKLLLLLLLLLHRWADKFCLHCNIFIYIRHIWIKPVLCSRIHHTSPLTHRCFQFSPSAHRNVRVFRCSVQTVCCYWILNQENSSSNWNSWMNASCLWSSMCSCEYSKMLGKAVHRWRIGASRFDWQNTKDRFKKLVQQWRKCTEVCGDYVEK